MAATQSSIAVNPNPLAFEELALSLASLNAYSQTGIAEPIDFFQTLYNRALQQPLGYRDITELAGYSYEVSDQKAGKAAWLLMNTRGVRATGVHSTLWHRIGGKCFLPMLDHLGRLLGREAVLPPDSVLNKFSDPPILDFAGVGKNDGTVWLAQAVYDKKVAESAFKRNAAGNTSLFKTRVFGAPLVDAKASQTLRLASQLVQNAFSGVKVLTLVIVMHPETPDFELYQVDCSGTEDSKPLPLLANRIVCNSIDFADRIENDHEALLALPVRANDDTFIDVPPCPGGRTLAILAVTAREQLEASDLVLWREQGIRKKLFDDYRYEVTRDKLRHDLVDRLIGQGFMRKWESDYILTVKGIARFQYCRAKYTTLGKVDAMTVLDNCARHRDRIVKRFGCLI